VSEILIEFQLNITILN